MQLSFELKQLDPNFLFEIVPIVLGATVLVTSDSWKNIEKLGIVNINDTLAKCQRMALLGTKKIVKSVMRMKHNWKIVIKNLPFNLICWEVLPQGNMVWFLALVCHWSANVPYIMLPPRWNTFVEVTSCTDWDDRTNCMIIRFCSNTLSQPCSVIAKSNSNHSKNVKSLLACKNL